MADPHVRLDVLAPAVGYPRRCEAVKVPGHSFRVRTATMEFSCESIWADSPNRIPFYDANSWGPTEADQLLARDGRSRHR